MSHSSEVRAEYLSYLEIEERIAQAPIAYLPLGALEFHGPHLPTGLDGLTAQGVCLAAAKMTGGVVLPTIYQGTGGEHSSYPWTLMMPTGKTLAENLMAILNRLEELGVKKTVILSGHFALEQQEVIRHISESWVSGSSRLMRLATRSMADNAEAPVSPDHAGVFETMLLAAIHPDLVQLNKLPDQMTHPSVDPDGNPFGSHRHNQDHALWGVFGPDPRSIELSEAGELLAAMVQWLADIATDKRN